MTTTTFTTTPQDRYLEDFVEGDIHEFGPNTITENDIIDFFSDLNETRIPFTQLLNIKEINFLGLFSEFAFIDDEEKEVIDYVDDCSKSLDTVIRIE